MIPASICQVTSTFHIIQVTALTLWRGKKQFLYARFHSHKISKYDNAVALLSHCALLLLRNNQRNILSFQLHKLSGNLCLSHYSISVIWLIALKCLLNNVLHFTESFLLLKLVVLFFSVISLIT